MYCLDEDYVEKFAMSTPSNWTVYLQRSHGDYLKMTETKREKKNRFDCDSNFSSSFSFHKYKQTPLPLLFLLFFEIQIKITNKNNKQFKRRFT